MWIGKPLTVLVLFTTCTVAVCATLHTAPGSAPLSEEKLQPPADAGALDKLIAQLGAESYREREDAVRRLIAFGPSAFAALKRIADDRKADPDVRLRAARAAFAIGSVKLESVRRFGNHNGWAIRVVLTPDGKQAVTSGFDALRLWDLSSGIQVRVFGQRQNGYWSLAFTGDGRRLIASSGDNSAYVFDMKTGKQLQRLIGHSQAVWGAVLTADGKQAITGAWDHTIRVWEVATGKQIRAFKNVRGSVRCLALSPDGKLLAAGHFAVVNGPGTIRLWDVEKGTEIRSMTGHELEVTHVEFSADGKQLVSSSFDKSVRIWRVADGKEIKRLQGHTGRIECAVFTPDGRRVVSCAAEDDPTLRLWDVSSGKQLGVSDPVPQGLLSAVVLADNRQCLTAGKDGAVRLWRWTR